MSTNPRVKLHTNQGDIVITLDAAKAQDGGQFPDLHQGRLLQRHGVPSRDRRLHGPGRRFRARHEAKQTHAPIENEANNGLKNDKYTLAMARTSDPHSATAQFFINVSNNDFLNFTAPAQWLGLCRVRHRDRSTDVVDKIKGVKTGNKGFHQNVPNEDVIIEKAEVLE